MPNLSYLLPLPKLFLKKGAFPEQVTFFVTPKCNARCKHCFAWKNLEDSESQVLKLDEIEKISRTMGHFTSGAPASGSSRSAIGGLARSNCWRCRPMMRSTTISVFSGGRRKPPDRGNPSRCDIASTGWTGSRSRRMTWPKSMRPEQGAPASPVNRDRPRAQRRNSWWISTADH